MVASLKKRGYVVWFGEIGLLGCFCDTAVLIRLLRADLESMKGSVVDA